MARKIQKIYISLGITFLILVTLACGSVQVGVVTPNPEGSKQPINDGQEPEPEPTATEWVQNTTENEPTPEPAEVIPTMAYKGPDNNVWVLEAGSETPRQMTFDANQVGDDSLEIVYSYPLLSSDGSLLAYYMSVGTPSASGYDYNYWVWVVNLIDGEGRQILDVRPTGMAWKPATHLLAYGHGVDMDYFISRGDPDSDQTPRSPHSPASPAAYSSSKAGTSAPLVR